MPPALIFSLESLAQKRLSLLSDLLPTASHLAILFNPNVPLGVINADQAETAARNLGKRVKKYTASSNEEIDAAFAAIAQDRVNALLRRRRADLQRPTRSHRCTSCKILAANDV
jgi:ABC-type uncharacterized transport system substrate-binding protein